MMRRRRIVVFDHAQVFRGGGTLRCGRAAGKLIDIKAGAPMLIRATRTISALSLRAMFYVALFIGVVIAHLSVTAALREHGWDSGAALFASGAAVLALVLAAVNVADWLRARHSERREFERERQRLPSGPCCVIWHTPEQPVRDVLDEEEGDPMPWAVVGPLRARYPRLARSLGIEGMAVAEFEVTAEGRAKNVYCVDAWPSDVFFEAAREALSLARFAPKHDVHMRFGATYRMPFIFRIAGASNLKDRGRRARKLRPALLVAQAAAKSAAEQVRRGFDR
jgi:TonB family protein